MRSESERARDMIESFERHFQADSEDPAMEGELSIWKAAYHAALASQGEQVAGDALTARDLSTSEGSRAYIADFFSKELRRHDFRNYITTRLAADFACALAQHLAARQPVGEIVITKDDGGNILAVTRQVFDKNDPHKSEIVKVLAEAPPVQPQTHAAAVPAGWRPINEAPEGRLCVVGWLDAEDSESPERHEFDYIENGCWVKHAELVEYAEAVAPAGSGMPPRDAPYRWFIEVPAMLAAAPAPGVES